MKNRSLILISSLLLSGVKVFAYDLSCSQLWTDRVHSKAQIGVPPKHLPRMHLNAEVPSKNSVIVLTHGTFESPYFVKGVGQALANEGYLVLSLLLPGHWEKNTKALGSVKYTDWVNEVNVNIQIAHCFSEKIILAGHSLGGLLSVNAALNQPELISGLILWSPALGLGVLPDIGASTALFGWNGNMFKYGEPDHNEVPFYTPNAPIQINALIREIAAKFGHIKPAGVYAPYDLESNQDQYPPHTLSARGIYKKIKAPLLLIYAEIDPIVSVSEMKQLYRQTSGQKTQLPFSILSGVTHRDIVKSKNDTYANEPHGYNPRFDEMVQKIILFLSHL